MKIQDAALVTGADSGLGVDFAQALRATSARSPRRSSLSGVIKLALRPRNDYE